MHNCNQIKGNLNDIYIILDSIKKELVCCKSDLANIYDIMKNNNKYTQNHFFFINENKILFENMHNNSEILFDKEYDEIKLQLSNIKCNYILTKEFQITIDKLINNMIYKIFFEYINYLKKLYYYINKNRIPLFDIVLEKNNKYRNTNCDKTITIGSCYFLYGIKFIKLEFALSELYKNLNKLQNDNIANINYNFVDYYNIKNKNELLYLKTFGDMYNKIKNKFDDHTKNIIKTLINNDKNIQNNMKRYMNNENNKLKNKINRLIDNMFIKKKIGSLYIKI